MASTARLVHKADFERLLSLRSFKRSAHFAVHHVQGSPAIPLKAVSPVVGPVMPELSTGGAPTMPKPVDDLPIDGFSPVSEAGSAAVSTADGQAQSWLGCVVPKRHAKRAVTRSLLKRHMRSSFESHSAGLPTGLWLLRLRSAFAVNTFVSARSAALAQAARQELDDLLLRCQSGQ
jgi:ribonuclease P protein component